MEGPREGGCVCGAVRYRVKNAPFRTLPSGIETFEKSAIQQPTRPPAARSS